MYLIRNILIPVGAPRQVLEAAAKRTGIPVDAIDHWQVIRKSIDARKKAGCALITRCVSAPQAR